MRKIKWGFIMKKTFKAFMILGLLAVSIHAFSADVPPYINYQGLLSQRNTEGVDQPVEGSRNLIFRFHTSEEPQDGEIALWEKIYSGVVITNGIFNIQLGPFDPVDIAHFASNQDIFLELEVGGEKFSRQKLISVGYAFRAQSTASIDDNTVNSSKIEDGTIQAVDLSSDALEGIGTEQIEDGAVTQDKLNWDLKTGTGGPEPSGPDPNYPDMTYGLVPRGAIIMWSGSVTPKGWALCNGENGTPNLSDKFIMGTTDYNRVIAQEQGGSFQHSHALTINLTSNGAHTPTGSVAGHALTINEMPSHNHANGVYKYLLKKDGNDTRLHGDQSPNEPNLLYAEEIQPAGGNAQGGTDAHSHGLTMNEVGPHTHGNNPDNPSVSDSRNHLPPCYVLAFIMKL
ncbi:MAG: tail fiber protein [bacterium]